MILIRPMHQVYSKIVHQAALIPAFYAANLNLFLLYLRDASGKLFLQLRPCDKFYAPTSGTNNGTNEKKMGNPNIL